MAMGRVASASAPSRFDTVDLGEQGLFLRPRLRFNLSFTRSHISLKPFDEWQLRQSLLSFLHNSLSISVPDTDLSIRRHKDLKSTLREDAVASGLLYIWDLTVSSFFCSLFLVLFVLFLSSFLSLFMFISLFHVLFCFFFHDVFSFPFSFKWIHICLCCL